jgi:tetratricopeptide (TPR) repeat protein
VAHRTDAAGTRLFATDILGNTVALLNGTGAIQTQYTYELFGKPSVSWRSDEACQGVNRPARPAERVDKLGSLYHTRILAWPRARIRILIATTLIRLGKFSEAAEQLKAAGDDCPEHLNIRARRAWILIQAGRYDESVREFREVLQRAPDYAYAHHGLACALQDLGNNDEAITSFRAALELEPEDPELHYNIGGSYFDIGNFQDAAASFRRAINLDPTYVDAIGSLGAALGQLGHWREAAECHRKALSIKPSAAHARNLGITLHQLEQYSSAEIAFRKAIALGNESAELKARLAEVVRDQGLARAEEALEIIEEALAQDPLDGGALVVKSGTLLVLDRPGDALAVARLAVEAHPEMEDAQGALGWALLKAGHPAEALSTFESLRRGRDIDLAAGRGAALTALNRHREAVAAFDEIRRIEPNYFDKHSDFAAEYVEKSRAALLGSG